MSNVNELYPEVDVTVNFFEIGAVALILLVFALSAMSSTLDVGPVTDARLRARRGTNVTFDPKHYASIQEWEPHAARLREQILTSCGLNPMPPKAALKVRIFDAIDRGDYTVERVTFQSYPGLYVVGNLYRPKGKPGPFPAILSPHGHCQNGRLEDSDLFSIPGRCINFAKMGMVAFSYSMLGYNENARIDHRFTSPMHELWGISPCALQLWNSIRALDFISSLPDVDPTRIGCTGASGGGTQTFLLSAIDDRVKVCAPVNMISHTMQGGCVCENAPLLRIDTNNVEIGSLMAPRPMMMIAATGDWTKETLEVEYPATREIYKLYGAGSKVGAYRQIADHNYNKDSRERVYPWFRRYLLNDTKAGDVTPEQPFKVEETKDLLAFTSLPEGALNLDQLTHMLIDLHESQINSFALNSRSSLDRFRRALGPALKACFAVDIPTKAGIRAEDRGRTDLPNCTVTRLVIGRRGVGDAIPALLFVLKQRNNAPPVLVVHPNGKSALLKDGAPADLITDLLARGSSVLAIDCFLTGESDKTDERLKEQFFTTFYRTDAAERVQDIVTALAYLKSRSGPKVDLIGLGKSGIGCLFARAFAGGDGATIIDASQFDPSNDQSFLDTFFIPGIRRVGDIRTAAAMIAPNRLMIHNADKAFPTNWIKRAFTASGLAANFEVMQSPLTEKQIVGKL